MNILINILAFIVAISILVAVHEFGHFWVARRLGFKVLRFSIGFGKPVWTKVGQGRRGVLHLQPPHRRLREDAGRARGPGGPPRTCLAPSPGARCGSAWRCCWLGR